ncbi:inosine/xanthosine triphosphatase [Marinomonas aquiplantarum]|uniref:Inosine/xanthosine triphosphatase n=1 Tax=Marinomonas aquiplantarum TaxID=491951 RepID=A0A366CYJ0_9GAMM|nr:inosine/xanthosine triphosphatase [Marinomonas aquiplantarum]RBO82910.1 inosine/xanthosine triphosphatase [Marinomonas aquiplantarum]
MTSVIRIQVGSTNPVKVAAAKQAFEQCHPDHIIHCEGRSTPSGVADQPMTESETRLGAVNRALTCQQDDFNKQFDFYISMEGGVDQFEEGAATFAYIAIVDQKGAQHIGRTANLPLPDQLFKRLQNQEELGPIMDETFNTENIRQKGGAIGLFTNHAATRQSVYSQAIILALAPILHPQHFSH